MYARVEKTKENKSRAIANTVAQKKSNVKQGFGFVDNRPESISQRKIQKMVNGNQKAKQSNVFFGKEKPLISASSIQRIQNDILTSKTVQKRSDKQGWEMPGKIKNHIFDGEEKGNNLSGLHSEGRKNESNGMLKYTEETKKYRNASKPYGAKVKTKFGDKWSPKNDAYKYSDMFPTSWSEAKVVEAIEAAYDSTFKYRSNGESIGRHDEWKNGKWLGNAKGIPIVIAGNPPETIYPKR